MYNIFKSGMKTSKKFTKHSSGNFVRQLPKFCLKPIVSCSKKLCGRYQHISFKNIKILCCFRYSKHLTAGHTFWQ